MYMQMGNKLGTVLSTVLLTVLCTVLNKTETMVDNSNCHPANKN